MLLAPSVYLAWHALNKHPKHHQYTLHTYLTSTYLGTGWPDIASGNIDVEVIVILLPPQCRIILRLDAPASSLRMFHGPIRLYLKKKHWNITMQIINILSSIEMHTTHHHHHHHHHIRFLRPHLQAFSSQLDAWPHFNKLFDKELNYLFWKFTNLK